MGIETATYIADLNAAWPLGTDGVSTADDHLRLIKAVLQNSFQSGTFTGTLTGCTTSPTDTISYTRSGLLVAIKIPAGALFATSNSITMTITGLPAVIIPINQTGFIALPELLNNSVRDFSQPSVRVKTDGTFDFFVNGGFTNSGVKGFDLDTSFVYSLA